MLLWKTTAYTWAWNNQCQNRKNNKFEHLYPDLQLWWSVAKLGKKNIFIKKRKTNNNIKNVWYTQRHHKIWNYKTVEATGKVNVRINTYLRIYLSVTQKQEKWEKTNLFFQQKPFSPSARRHQNYLFISLYFSAASYCIFSQNQDVIFPENDQLPPTEFDYIPTRVTPARMRNWCENESFLHRNRFSNGKQLSH